MRTRTHTHTHTFLMVHTHARSAGLASFLVGEDVTVRRYVLHYRTRFIITTYSCTRIRIHMHTPTRTMITRTSITVPTIRLCYNFTRGSFDALNHQRSRTTTLTLQTLALNTRTRCHTHLVHTRIHSIEHSLRDHHSLILLQPRPSTPMRVNLIRPNVMP